MICIHLHNPFHHQRKWNKNKIEGEKKRKVEFLSCILHPIEYACGLKKTSTQRGGKEAGEGMNHTTNWTGIRKGSYVWEVNQDYHIPPPTHTHTHIYIHTHNYIHASSISPTHTHADRVTSLISNKLLAATIPRSLHLVTAGRCEEETQSTSSSESGRKRHYLRRNCKLPTEVQKEREGREEW